MLFIILYSLLLIVKSEWNFNGTENNKIIIDGLQREFLLYYPNSLRNVKKTTTVPLWVILHGQSVNIKTFYDVSDFYLVAEDKKIVLLFVQGHCSFDEWFCCWNTGHLRGLLDLDWNQNDIKFIDETITEVLNYNPITDLSIDKNKIIMMGYSAGAFMSYTYAINTTTHNIHTAIGVAGHIGGKAYPWQPPPRSYDPSNWGYLGDTRPNIIMVFGEKDILVKIEGGEDFLKRTDFSMEDDINFFKSEHSCEDHESIKYDMNEYLKLTVHGKNCDGKILSIIAKDVNHYWKNYDKLFQNEELPKETFAEHSQTLSEFLYNINEYEINDIERPNKDPDPIPPTDSCYEYFPFYNLCNNGYILTISKIYVLLLIVFLFL